MLGYSNITIVGNVGDLDVFCGAPGQIDVVVAGRAGGDQPQLGEVAQDFCIEP